MKEKKAKKSHDGASRKVVHELEGAASGAVAGAAFGAAGGPIGIAAGAVLGGAAGAMAGGALDSQEVEDDQRTTDLDVAIGVDGGDLGAPNLKHPPAKRGVYSAASMGSSSTGGGDDEAPAEGGIEPPRP